MRLANPGEQQRFDLDLWGTFRPSRASELAGTTEVLDAQRAGLAAQDAAAQAFRNATVAAMAAVGQRVKPLEDVARLRCPSRSIATTASRGQRLLPCCCVSRLQSPQSDDMLALPSAPASVDSERRPLALPARATALSTAHIPGCAVVHSPLHPAAAHTPSAIRRRRPVGCRAPALLPRLRATARRHSRSAPLQGPLRPPHRWPRVAGAAHWLCRPSASRKPDAPATHSRLRKRQHSPRDPGTVAADLRGGATWWC